MTLRPPVEPMLARAAEAVPGPGVLGELAFEQKFDGYRALLFTPTAPESDWCCRAGAGGRSRTGSPVKGDSSRRRRRR